jgi:hypothetical protein
MRFSAQLVVCDRGDHRTALRDDVNAPSTLRSQNGGAVDVQIRNLSATGCFVESVMDLAIDDAVRIGLAGSGTIEGRLVRKSSDGFAVMFDRGLTLGELERAFKGAEIIQPWRSTNADQSLPEQYDRWPRPVRTGIILGSAIGLWALILIAASSF